VTRRQVRVTTSGRPRRRQHGTPPGRFPKAVAAGKLSRSRAPIGDDARSSNRAPDAVVAG
ncbi:hypothetical protein, partial [Nocardia nova]|uniref:hypothetical protein n=1 Tax=Nocardia nova TaxID=37330 RepID=UPI0025B0FB4D